MKGRSLPYLIAVLILGVLAMTATDAAAQSWKFVVMADSQGYGGDNVDRVSVTTLGDMATYVASTEQPDLVVFVGDLSDPTTSQAAVESSLSTWKTTMAPVYNAGIDVYPIRGSHDLGGNTKQSYSDTAWRNVMTGLPNNGPAGEEGLTYSVTHNNATFLLMDEWGNNPGQWSTVNDAWVAAQAAANTSPHLFSFTHSQIVKVEHTFCLDQNATTERNAIVDSLTGAGAKVHFTGHMHLSNYTKLNDDVLDPTDSAEEDNYYQVIVAPASQKFYNWDPEVYDGNAIPDMTASNLHNTEYTNGYTVVEVDGNDVTVTFMRKYGAGDYRSDASFSYTAVPEPVTMSLLAFGALGVLLRRKRR